MKRKILSVLFAIMVVTSGVALVATPVAADHDCSTVNKVTWFAFSGPSLFGEATDGSGVGCDMFHEDTSVQEVVEAEEEQTELDLYTAATAQNADQENFNSLYDNYLQDTDSVAWQKAEAAIAEAYKNGSTKAEAKIAAQEAIGEYYATKQINLINNWNTTVLATYSLRERAIQEGSINNHSASDVTHDPQDVHIIVHRISTNQGQNASMTLVNDTEHTSEGILTARSGSTNLDRNVHHPALGNTSNYGHDSVVTGIHVNAPNEDYDRVHTIKFYKYQERWNLIEQKHSEIVSESDALVDATWQDFQDGNINASQVLSRSTIMFEYGTASYQNGSGFYDMVAAASGMGLATPDLETEGLMTIKVEGVNDPHTGMVFARSVPNGTWTVNKTYNPANFSGPVMIATTDGRMFEETRNFTITEATKRDGTSVDEVAAVSYNYQTSNTTDLNDKYANLLNATQALQERIDELSAGGDSGDDSPDVDSTIVIIGVALAAAVAIGLSRKD